jgi:U3 small nucleolar RNA-associated protein 22
VRVLHTTYGAVTNASGALVAMYSTRTGIRLCCRLHAVNSMRVVDVGPAADDTQGAAGFRAFWGAKSELRRFQDGKICESVAWVSSDENIASRHDVTRQLLNFIVPHHCPEVTGVDVPAMALVQALQRAHVSPSSEALYERACLNGVTKLTKLLRGLDAEAITLSIVNVQPVEAVLRQTAVYPPVPHQLAGSSLANTSDVIPRCLPAIEVLCQLEGSGKWPDAPAAYAKMKAALGVQLARALKTSYSIDAIASEHCVDVLLDGFAYRLTLYSEREPADVLSTIALRQAHQGLVSSLAAEHPSFKSCCRMAKLWVSRQHLSNHICEEATELVCAAAYTTKISIGGACPTSPESGFLSFLDIMAYHPWEAQPLTLDDKVSEEAARLMTRMRAIGKAPSMFVVMGSAGTDASATASSQSMALPPSKASLSNKLQCVAWTAQAPDEVILFRASALARKAIKTIVSNLNSDYSECNGMPGPLSPMPSRVFGHSMSDYDLVVVLKASALVGDRTEAAGMVVSRDHHIDASSEAAGVPGAPDNKYCQAVLSGIPASLAQQRGAKIKKELLIGFDPMPLFCELLRDRYQHIAIVCANTLDGKTVGIKIKPRFCRPEGVAFDADFGCSVFRPVPGLADGCGDTVVVCKEAFAHDIVHLGSGIVESVNY